MKTRNIFSVMLIAFLHCTIFVSAQNYQAFYGSNYFGSLNATQNPASILHNPYKWDLTLFSGQYTATTNALVANKKTPFKLPLSADFTMIPGEFDRYAYVNTDFHILNGRFSINNRNAVGFGANIRGYGNLASLPFFYSDTITTTTSFFKANNHNDFHLMLEESAWLEIYGSYATTVLENSMGKLNAGVTLKFTKGITSGIAEVKDVNLVSGISDEGPDIFLRNGRAFYGYSATHDVYEDTKNASGMLKSALPGFSFDAGVEFIVNSSVVSSFNDGPSEYDYSWKFGISLLDIGWNNFKYSRNSMSFANLHENINGVTANNKLYEVQSVAEMNDSLSTMVNSAAHLTGNYKVINPARVVLNADHKINEEFAVNANLSLNLTSLAGGRYSVNEKQLFTITPRWEKHKFGLYMPIQINTDGKLWLGGAGRIGPVFMGLHNIPNALFGGNHPHNGGGFMGIIIKPFNKNAGSGFDDLDCPDIRY